MDDAAWWFSRNYGMGLHAFAGCKCWGTPINLVGWSDKSEEMHQQSLGVDQPQIPPLKWKKTVEWHVYVIISIYLWYFSVKKVRLKAWPNRFLIFPGSATDFPFYLGQWKILSCIDNRYIYICILVCTSQYSISISMSMSMSMSMSISISTSIWYMVYAVWCMV